MSVGEVLRQLQQAREHADRARAMIRSALEEVSRADVLVRESLRGVSDQTLIGVVDRTRQQLVDAGQGTTETTVRIDETIARLGGRGNW
ncbi:DUF6244 family protein [Micromonosporaceae bacterium B7E4]